VVVVHPSVPAKTIPEFIAYAKANTGKISFASGGNGKPSHVAGELFTMMTGAVMTHVPYRGGGAGLPDMLSGQVQVMFIPPPAVVDHIRAGTLRALAVTRRRPTCPRARLSDPLSRPAASPASALAAIRNALPAAAPEPTAAGSNG
jgi:tripartite-type tricarboxylate transporter receptor subunit TctC